MFYRVTILEKNDNHREMIVKAENKAAALTQIPAAKAFLFPGEDASETRLLLARCIWMFWKREFLIGELA